MLRDCNNIIAENAIFRCFLPKRQTILLAKDFDLDNYDRIDWFTPELDGLFYNSTSHTEFFQPGTG